MYRSIWFCIIVRFPLLSSISRSVGAVALKQSMCLQNIKLSLVLVTTFHMLPARLIISFYIALLFIKNHHSLIVAVIKLRNQYVITTYEASKDKYSLSSVGSWTLINQI